MIATAKRHKRPPLVSRGGRVKQGNPVRSAPDYFPGKKGQNIGIRITEIIKDTITRPVPAFT